MIGQNRKPLNRVLHSHPSATLSRSSLDKYTHAIECVDSYSGAKIVLSPVFRGAEEV
jgi:hypothetical protein